jgi:hypothetical protein
MSASASSSSAWPTPATRDHKGANGADHLENGTGRFHLDQLPNFVEHIWYPQNVHLWTTPSAGDGQRGGTITETMSGTSLTQQVNTLWATPQARDHMPPHSPERIAAMKAEGHGMRNLNDEAALWQTPRGIEGEKGGNWQKSGNSPAVLTLTGQAKAIYSRLAQVTVKTGKPHSKERRSLNPLFVEWLMGWPPGWTLGVWTDFACSAMELSRYRQRMRFALSQLASPAEAPPAQLALFG